MEPYGNPLVRNLLYYVYPVKGNGIWQWNVGHLLKRIGQFNGKRIVAVATDCTTDSIGIVKEAFGKNIEHFIELKNEPYLRDVKAFPLLFNEVASHAPNEITMYGHTKGVWRSTFNPGMADAIRRWAEVSYAAAMDYPDLVEKALVRHPIAGVFFRGGMVVPPSAAPWHFSSTFFWVRHSKTFNRFNWDRIDQYPLGMEMWPGNVFLSGEAAVLFGCGGHELNLYCAGFWQGTMEPLWASWQERNKEHKVY